MRNPSRAVGQRRLRVNEMDRVDTKEIRPTVKPHQGLTYFQTASGVVWIELIWVKHTEGTFGPGSAAYANRLRAHIAEHTPLKGEHIYRTNDRGSRCGWMMFFSCPRCSRRCRVLYSKKGMKEFECIRCNRPAYPSNCWPYTGRRNACGTSLLRREAIKNRQAANRKLRSIALKKGQRKRELMSMSANIHSGAAQMHEAKIAILTSHRGSS